VATSHAIESSAPRASFETLFLCVGIAEVAVGLTALLLADFAALFASLAWMLGIGGIIALLTCILNPREVKIYDLFAAALLVGYGSGSLNSVLAYANNGENLLGAALVSEYWLTKTLSLVAITCGGLHLMGRTDSDGYLFRPFAIEPRFCDRTLLLALAVLGAYVGLVAMGTIGFRGNILGAEVAHRVSRSGTIVLVLLTPIGALAMVAMLMETRRFRRALLALTGASLLIAQLGLGRRVFLFSLLTYALAMLAFKPPRRLLTLKNIGITLVALVLVQFATSFFYAMRIADNSQSGQERPGMIQLIPKAMEIYLDENSGLDDKISANLKSRTFVLQYLADISQRAADVGPLLGLNTLRAIVFATPNALYPGKYLNPLFIQEESLINPHFLLPILDSASSVLTAGVADFGTPGLLLYPLLVCLGYSVLLRAFRHAVSPMAVLLFSLFLAQDLMSVENDLSYYFSACLRAMVITLLAAVFLFPRSKPSTAPRTAVPLTMQREH
jgi:hypothetical protein